VEHVHEVGDAERGPPSELAEDLDGPKISFACRHRDVLAPHELGLASELDQPVAVAGLGRLTAETPEPAAGRVTLPAAAAPARTRDPVGIDDHVARLACETVVTALQRASGDDTAADAGAERD